VKQPNIHRRDIKGELREQSEREKRKHPNRIIPHTNERKNPKKKGEKQSEDGRRDREGTSRKGANQEKGTTLILNRDSW